jgi:hypothetical protein
MPFCNGYLTLLFAICMFYRLQRFLETAGSVLNYFESFLGRIEIMGSSKTMERVYFEINESNIEQWEKPQIKVRLVNSGAINKHVCSKIR